MLRQLFSSGASSQLELWDISKHLTDQGYTVHKVDELLDGTKCVHKVTLNFWSLGFEAVPSATARPRMIVLFPSTSAQSLGETRGDGYSAFRSAEVTKHAPDLAMLSVTVELAPVHSIIIQLCQVRFHFLFRFHF